MCLYPKLHLEFMKMIQALEYSIELNITINFSNTMGVTLHALVGLPAVGVLRSQGVIVDIAVHSKGARGLRNNRLEVRCHPTGDCATRMISLRNPKIDC